MIFEEPRPRRMSCCRNIFCKLGVVPFLFSCGSILTILITYTISVAREDVYPFFPTISDTGGIPPESNVFGFLLSLCSFLGFVSVLIRYYQYRFISESNEEHRPRLLCVNKLSLCLGITSTTGALIVAAFQDRGKSSFEHMIGAMLVFGFGVLYTFVQTYLTFNMMACGMNSKKVFIVRLTLSILSLVFFVSLQILQKSAGEARNKNPPTDPGHDIPHWYPEDAGFVYNVLANISEWSMAFSFFFYFLTFVGEFNKVKMNFSFKSGDYNLLIPFSTAENDDIEKDFSYIPA